ncbi:aldo/keto reductase, partial [Chloroflexota bacterium]
YGFLTGAYSADELFDKQDQRSKWSSQQIERWANAYMVFLENLSLEEQYTGTQLALRFCLSYPGVSTVIPGMLTEEHVIENVASIRAGVLSPKILQSIGNTYQRNVFFGN